jgi:hypothetical protein
LFPKAKWGFRQREEDISYSRQTYPIGTQVEVDIGSDKYCVINEQLPISKPNLKHFKDVHVLKDLLTFSKEIEVKQFQADNMAEEEL